MNSAPALSVAPVVELAQASPHPGSGLTAIGIVAADEFRHSVRSRWIFVFTATFAVLALGLSYFGMAGAGRSGFQSFERVTASLLNLVLFWVPLAAILLATVRLTGSREALAFLLVQPLSRSQALLGKYLGLLCAIVLAQAVGFGGAGLVIAQAAGNAQALGFVALVALSILLAAIFLALGTALSAWWPDRVQSLGAGLVTWLAATVLYDLLAVGVTSLVYGLPVRALLATAVWLNPVDLCRVLATTALGDHALFGPTGAAVGAFLRTPAGIVTATCSLIAWIVLPLAIALVAFRRRDF
jgi:Cu-processing system permease protein